MNADTRTLRFVFLSRAPFARPSRTALASWATRLASTSFGKPAFSHGPPPVTAPPASRSASPSKTAPVPIRLARLMKSLLYPCDYFPHPGPTRADESRPPGQQARAGPYLRNPLWHWLHEEFRVLLALSTA